MAPEADLSDARSDLGADPLHSDDRLLSKIAELLGKPTTAFFDGSAHLAELDQTSELLRIWDRLHCRPAARRQLLALARTLNAGRPAPDNSQADLDQSPPVEAAAGVTD